MNTVTGQMTNESFSGRVISIDSVRVPTHFSIPAAAEKESVQSENRPDYSDGSADTSHTHK